MRHDGVRGRALKAPCAPALGRRPPVRFLCYSDIVPLLGTEQLDGRAAAVPRRMRHGPAGQNCDEYPVLTMYFMRVAAWLSGNDYASFYFVNAALLFAVRRC